MGSTEVWWYKERLPELQEEERKRKEKENSQDLIKMVEEMKENRKKMPENEEKG